MNRPVYLFAAMVLGGIPAAASAQIVGVATNPQGSLYYSVGSAAASVIQQKGGLTARVQPMSRRALLQGSRTVAAEKTVA
ncbi:MAG: hypothetical protein HYY28_00225 [Betaproteobacteria bacterium]|nr:hypothetical protein [Betaproteobacteria bacterium]MBI2958712.1 hypothetical protein [Betaproteobacteria bacterium]